MLFTVREELQERQHEGLKAGDRHRGTLKRSLGHEFVDVVRTLGVSQEELSHRAQLDCTYISGIERGRRNVSLENICRLAVALQVDAGDLLRGLRPSPEPSPP